MRPRGKRGSSPKRDRWPTGIWPSWPASSCGTPYASAKPSRRCAAAATYENEYTFDVLTFAESGLFTEQTTNEMCFGFVGVTGDKPGPVHFYIDEGRKVLLPPKRLTDGKRD